MPFLAGGDDQRVSNIFNFLLKDLLKNTPDSHADAANLTKALNLMKGISDELNESIRQSEQQRKFGDLAQGEGFKVFTFTP